MHERRTLTYERLVRSVRCWKPRTCRRTSRLTRRHAHGAPRATCATGQRRRGQVTRGEGPRSRWKTRESDDAELPRAAALVPPWTAALVPPRAASSNSSATDNSGSAATRREARVEVTFCKGDRSSSGRVYEGGASTSADSVAVAAPVAAAASDAGPVAPVAAVAQLHLCFCFSPGQRWRWGTSWGPGRVRDARARTTKSLGVYRRIIGTRVART